MRKLTPKSNWNRLRPLLLPALLGAVLGCAAGSRSGGGSGGGGGGGGGDATPEVEYIGPQNTALPDGTQVELLFTPPARPSGDLGTIRVTCATKGCPYAAASAAMMTKARQVGASGVHSIKESSGNVSDPMDSVASKNGRVYVMAGTAFAYSN